MPIVLVYGIIRKKVSKAGLRILRNRIQQVVADVPEMRVEKTSTSVFYVPDIDPDALGDEIVVFIEGLYQKPERTPEVRQRVAEAVASEINSFVQGNGLACTFVEVMTRTQRPGDARATRQIVSAA